MKLIGLMLARNEEWVLRASIPSALSWVDELLFFDHRSTDATNAIVADFQKHARGRISYYLEPVGTWHDLVNRQETLRLGRELGGTHFAVCDADEVMTVETAREIRSRIEALRPGEFLNIPYRNLWRDLDHVRDDKSHWANQGRPHSFCDIKRATWLRPGRYQQHMAMPRGITKRVPWDCDGLMHLQFANWRRLLAKHAWYKMNERILYPHLPVCEIERRFNNAPSGRDAPVKPIPDHWWPAGLKDEVDLDSVPWHEAECKRLMDKHGRAYFRGLTFFGVV